MNCGTKKMKKGGMTAKPMKYQAGGAVQGRKAPSYEEDMTPPRGMTRPVRPAKPAPRRAPSYEEDMTPPRGMRGFRSTAVPTDEPMPGSRYKKGGMIKKGKK